MRKVELFPTRDCEAGYAPGHRSKSEAIRAYNLYPGGPLECQGGIRLVQKFT